MHEVLKRVRESQPVDAAPQVGVDLGLAGDFRSVSPTVDSGQWLPPRPLPLIPADVSTPAPPVLQGLDIPPPHHSLVDLGPLWIGPPF